MQSRSFPAEIMYWAYWMTYSMKHFSLLRHRNQFDIGQANNCDRASAWVLIGIMWPPTGLDPTSCKHSQSVVLLDRILTIQACASYSNTSLTDLILPAQSRYQPLSRRRYCKRSAGIGTTTETLVRQLPGLPDLFLRPCTYCSPWSRTNAASYQIIFPWLKTDIPKTMQLCARSHVGKFSSMHGTLESVVGWNTLPDSSSIAIVCDSAGNVWDSPVLRDQG